MVFEEVLGIGVKEVEVIKIFCNFENVLIEVIMKRTIILLLTIFGGVFSLRAQYPPWIGLQWVKYIEGTDSTNNWTAGMTTYYNRAICAFLVKDTIDVDPDSSQHLIIPNNGTMAIACYSEQGNLLWAKQIDNLKESSLTLMNGKNLLISANGKLYIAGCFGKGAGTSSSVDFDPGPGTHYETTIASQDMFLLALDINDGSFLWVKRTYGDTNAVCVPSEIYWNFSIDKLIIHGLQEKKVNMNFNNGVFFLDTLGRKLSFIAQVSVNGNLTAATLISLYPTSPPHVFSVQDYQYHAFVVVQDSILYLINNNFNVLWKDTLFPGIKVKRITGLYYPMGILLNYTFKDTIPCNILQHNTSGCYLVPAGEEDWAVTRIDTGGNYIWTKHYPNKGHIELNGPAFNNIYQGSLTVGRFGGVGIPSSPDTLYLATSNPYVPTDFITCSGAASFISFRNETDWEPAYSLGVIQHLVFQPLSDSSDFFNPLFEIKHTALMGSWILANIKENTLFTPVGYGYPVPFLKDTIIKKTNTETILMLFYNVPPENLETRNFSPLKILPNPTREYFTVKSENFLQGTIEVYNLLGKKVLTASYHRNEKIDVRHLPSGMYILKATDRFGKSYRGKLLKY